jgi:hypothetical protein
VGATNQDFGIYSGNSPTISITVYQSDGVTPLNLTGMTAQWRLCSLFDPTPIVTKTVGAGISILNAAAGTVAISLTTADTDNLGGQPYRHELEIIDGAGNRTTVTTGTVTVDQSLFT